MYDYFIIFAVQSLHIQMNKFGFIVLFMLCILQCQGQQVVTWKMLADVTFKEEYNKEYDFNVLYPKFGEKVKALAGKQIIIEGYAIPVEELGADILVLSGLPYSQCFFCGGAGPESVMDIKSKKKMKFKVDKKLKLKGTLKLNEKDLSKLNYILENAELVN
jgi:hypothetical protein